MSKKQDAKLATMREHAEIRRRIAAETHAELLEAALAAARALPSAPPYSPAPAPPIAASAPEDHRAVYEDLKNRNPYLAMQYLDWHAQEIFPAK